MKPQFNFETQSIADGLRHSLEIYRPQELASKLAISPEAVRSAIRSGKLRAHKVNRRVFHIESFEAARWWMSLAE